MRILACYVGAIVIFMAGKCAFAESMEETVNTNVDANLSMRGYSLKGQFVAVPIPMSNPTLGSGLQLALLYLHPKKSQNPSSPNATTGVGAMYTDTNSKLAGLFHDNSFLGDKYRIRAGVVSGKLKLKFYGNGNDPLFSDNPISYSIKGDMGLIQALRRIARSEQWYIGLRTVYMKTAINFDFKQQIPGVPLLENEINLVNFALLVNYDSRNNNYYPTSGTFLETSMARNDKDWGSDVNYNRYTIKFNQYYPVKQNSVVAFRLFASQVKGNAPFFVLPHLSMRGFSNALY